MELMNIICLHNSVFIRRLFCFYLLSLFAVCNVYCQTDSFSNKSIIEIARAISSEEDDADIEELYNQLIDLWNNPININTANAEELSKIPFLNEFQIFSIIEQRKKSGNYLSLFELSYLGGFDKQTCQWLSNFLMVGKGVEFVSRKFKSSVLTLVESNFENDQLSGLPFKLRVKNKSSVGKLSFGFTAENDKNERFFNNPNSLGFDFYSGYLQFENKNSVFRKIIIGDYHVAIGQGCSLWTPYSFGKGNSAINISKKGDGVKKYSSSDENRFFRGVAVSLKSGILNTNIFVSYRLLDASLNESMIEPTVKSFLVDGNHITQSQIDNKDRVGEILYGVNSYLSVSKFKVGVSGYKLHYNNVLVPDKEGVLYSDNFGFSSYFNLWFKKFTLSGEVAFDRKMHLSTIVNSNYKLFDGLILASFYRYYSSYYWAQYSNAISENSENVNEKGFYFGAKYSPLPNWDINVYSDFFNFKRPQFQTNQPSSGNELLLYVEGKKVFGGQLLLKYKQEQKENVNNIDTLSINNQVTIIKRQLVARYSVRLSEKFKYQTSFSLSFYSQQNNSCTNGVLFYNELFYNNSLFALSSRLTLFDISDWENRLYTYEYAPLYVFSSALNYGEGAKIYFNFSTTLYKNIDIWAKYSHIATFKNGVGSSIEHRNIVILQLRYKF